MSRFIDKLKEASHSEPQPMGFGRGKSASKPSLVLVAEIKEKAAAAATEGADAVLSSGEAGKTAGKSDIPSGVRLSGGKTGKLEGVDFVVLRPEMPVDMVSDEKTGKVMAVEASLELGLLRSMDDMPLDALLVTVEEVQGKIITWQYLMLCKRCAALCGKPVLAAVSAQISKDELQMIWNAGVAGVVAEVKAAGDAKKLRALIDGLTPPSKSKGKKLRAIVPLLREEAAPVIDEDEEEEEE